MTWKVWLSFSIQFIILICIIFTIEFFHAKGHECDIPLYLWLDIFFAIVVLKALMEVNMFWIVRCKPNWLVGFAALVFVIWLAILSAWIIYGYFIYFSDYNNC